VSALPNAKTQFKVHFKPLTKLPEEVGRAVAAKRARYLAGDNLYFVAKPPEETTSQHIG
jgi:hypothetical protein